MSNTALVTGGARRLGRGITEYFLNRDWEVLIHFHRSNQQAEELAEQPNATTLQADLTNPKQLEELTDRISQQSGSLDVLVNNAAIFQSTPLDQINKNQWDNHMDLNAWAPVELTRFVSDLLTDSGGAIVNVLDWSIRRPYPSYLAYQASKGALQTLTRALARELAPEVRVNGVAPGPIEFPPDADSKHRKSILEKTLLDREGTREEFARAVYFLAEGASYTTGSVLEVDGGRHLSQ